MPRRCPKAKCQQCTSSMCVYPNSGTGESSQAWECFPLMADLSMIPDKTWDDYLKLAEASVCRYKAERDWEDIWSHVLQELCMGLKRLPQAAAAEAWRLIPRIATCAVANWMRSPENPRRRVTRDGNTLPEIVSWERLTEESDGFLGRSHVPDFAPRLIYRLWAQAVLTEALSLMSEAQRLRTWRYLIGEPLSEEGEAVSEANALFAGGLNRYLRHHGLPLKRHGRETLCRKPIDAADERARRAAWARSREAKKKVTIP